MDDVIREEQWIEASDVLPMFPTLVWEIHLKPELHQALDARIRQAIATARRDMPAPLPGHGWQSDPRLHELEELQALVPCIHSAAKSVLRFLRIGYEAIEITGCWATVLAEGATHGTHSHPNNFLSGVYYVQTHPGADAIRFHDPRNQTGIIRPPVVELTHENADQVVVRVRNGTLLLFPSYLQHSVATNTSGKERISVSFNLMFSSYTEKLSRPLW